VRRRAFLAGAAGAAAAAVVPIVASALETVREAARLGQINQGPAQEFITVLK